MITTRKPYRAWYTADSLGIPTDRLGSHFFTTITSTACMVYHRVSYLTQMWIVTRSKHIERIRSLWSIFSHLWTCFSLPRLWFLNLNPPELHINLDLCHIDLGIFPDIICIYLPNAKWARVHVNLFDCFRSPLTKTVGLISGKRRLCCTNRISRTSEHTLQKENDSRQILQYSGISGKASNMWLPCVLFPFNVQLDSYAP